MGMRRAGRRLVVAGVVWAWLGVLFNLPPASLIQDARSGLGAVLPVEWLVGAGTVGLATVGLLWGLWLWYRGRYRALSLAWIFVLFYVFSRVEMSTGRVALGTVGHGKFLPGACVLAMTMGHVFGHAKHDVDGGDRRSVDYAAGIVAALYLWAGVVKLQAGGLAWPERANVSLLAYERSFDAPWLLAWIRSWVGTHPVVGTFGAVVVLVVEVGAGLFVIPRLRVWVALAITVMHLSIGLLVDYLYLEWIFVVWGLALWTRSYKPAAA